MRWSGGGERQSTEVRSGEGTQRTQIYEMGADLSPEQSDEIRCQRSYNRGVTAKHRVTADFLKDLDVVCPVRSSGRPSAEFLSDLETVYAYAVAVHSEDSTGDLMELGRTFEELRNHYQAELKTLLDSVDKDDPILCPVSLFGTMELGRRETAHTRALAWLLDPAGEHGFGNVLLEALLNSRLQGEQRRVHITVVNRVACECRVDCDPDEEDAGRLDVFAEGRWEEESQESPWRLVIEAKIDAHESKEQLARYDAAMMLDGDGANVLRVFLTRDGRQPETHEDVEWQSMAFLELAEVFGRELANLKDRHGYHFLRYYLAGVLRDICEVSVDLSEHCRNPYAAVDYLRTVRRDHDDKHR